MLTHLPRPLTMLITLMVSGCVLPEYERPTGNAESRIGATASGGVAQVGGSLAAAGTQNSDTIVRASGGGTLGQVGDGDTGTSGGIFNALSFGGDSTVSLGNGTGGVPSSVTQQRGTGGSVSSSTDLAQGGTPGNSCGGSSDGGGVCDCATGGTSSCPDGYADCNASGSCEVELANNVTHCGRCGYSCNKLAPVGTTRWQCLQGSCVIAECEDGFGDCDGLASTGCETNTRVDANHCGGCFSSTCSYPVCADSICAATNTAGRCDLAIKPADVPNQNLVVLPTSTIWVWQTSLNANDAVVALGAITNTRGYLYAGTFRMALYDDVNGTPNAPVLTMPGTSTLDANDGMQEFVLSQPYRVPRTGQYWVAIWSSSVHSIKIVTYNLKQSESVQTVGAAFEGGNWPSGVQWSNSLSPVPPPQGAVGFYPNIYARYVDGRKL